MNKKVYKQPQIFYIPLQTECLLQPFSTETEDYTGGGETGIVYGDTGGAEELSKEHFNDFDSWDSWD